MDCERSPERIPARTFQAVFPDSRAARDAIRRRRLNFGRFHDKVTVRKMVEDLSETEFYNQWNEGEK